VAREESTYEKSIYEHVAQRCESGSWYRNRHLEGVRPPAANSRIKRSEQSNYFLLVG
jgi:hypothetical protein